MQEAKTGGDGEIGGQTALPNECDQCAAQQNGARRPEREPAQPIGDDDAGACRESQADEGMARLVSDGGCEGGVQEEEGGGNRSSFTEREGLSLFR